MIKSALLRIDITPAVGLLIGGNVRADNISRGIHDSLYANIILLEDKGSKVCFVGLDLLGLHYESHRLIKSGIEKKTGLSAKNIVVTTTHTHSGPDVLDFFKAGIDPECIRYIQDTAEKISDGVKQIAGQTEDTLLKIARKSVAGLSFNRRLIMKNGPMLMNWEYPDEDTVLKEAGPIDPDLFVISLWDTGGKLKALMVNFTLHPAVLVGQDWLWSRDYIHYLDSYVKNRLGSEVMVFFANGAEGNINHINFRDKNQNRGFEEAKRIGEKLGGYVVEVLDSAEPLKNPSLAVRSHTVQFPLRKITGEDVKKAKELLEKSGGVIPSLLDGCPEEAYAAMIIKMSQWKEKHVKTVMQAVKLSDDTAVATLPGEVFVEFGLKIKEMSPFRNTMIFGLTNDCIGYVPTEISFKQGGYEVKTATSSKLDPLAGDMMVVEAKQLLQGL